MHSVVERALAGRRRDGFQTRPRLAQQLRRGWLYIFCADAIEGNSESGNQKRVHLAGHDQSLAGTVARARGRRDVRIHTPFRRISYN